MSVVIATRNRPELLRLCLVAVFGQDSDATVEAIVVFDQCELDRSLIEDFPGQRVRILSNDRTPGLAGARNTGMLASDATWIAYCDDDDEWLPDKLSKQLALADANPDFDFIVGGILIDSDGNDLERPHAAPSLSHDDFLKSRVAEAHPSTFLLRREPFLEGVGLMDEGLAMGTDLDLLLRYSATKNVLAVLEPVVRIRMHAISYFTSNWDNRIAALDQILERHPEFAAVPTGMARLKGRRAFALAAAGRREEAIKESLATLKLNWRERRALLAIAVSLSLVSAERLTRYAAKRGRGV